MNLLFWDFCHWWWLFIQIFYRNAQIQQNLDAIKKEAAAEKRSRLQAEQENTTIRDRYIFWLFYKIDHEPFANKALEVKHLCMALLNVFKRVFNLCPCIVEVRGSNPYSQQLFCRMLWNM